MPSHKLVVFSNPASPDEEADYNEWYNSRHLPDVGRVKGVVSAQRFVLDGAFGETQLGKKYKYMAIYDIEADDIKAFMAELERLGGTEAIPLSPTFSPDFDAPLFKQIYAYTVPTS